MKIQNSGVHMPSYIEVMTPVQFKLDFVFIISEFENFEKVLPELRFEVNTTHKRMDIYGLDFIMSDSKTFEEYNQSIRYPVVLSNSVNTFTPKFLMYKGILWFKNDSFEERAIVGIKLGANNNECNNR